MREYGSSKSEKHLNLSMQIRTEGFALDCVKFMKDRAALKVPITPGDLIEFVSDEIYEAIDQAEALEITSQAVGHEVKEG